MSTYERIPMTKLSKSALYPSISSSISGLDLYSSQHYTIPPHQRILVKTGISMAIPYGYYGREAPITELSTTYGIDVGAGVIDSDYRGEVHCLLFNFSDKDYLISPGDRIAHLIIQEISMAEVQELTELDIILE